MKPRIHHTVHPDARLSFNDWHQYIYEERFRMLFNGLKIKFKNQYNAKGIQD